MKWWEAQAAVVQAVWPVDGPFDVLSILDNVVDGHPVPCATGRIGHFQLYSDGKRWATVTWYSDDTPETLAERAVESNRELGWRR